MKSMSYTSPALFLLLNALFTSFFVRHCDCYPVIVAVDEETQRCFRFNIPERDDAHIAVLVLPEVDESEFENVETWHVDQVYKMTKLKTKEEGLPSLFPEEQPNDVAKQVSEYLQKHGAEKSHTSLKITSATSDETNPHYEYNHKAKFFTPMVVNFVHKAVRGKDYKEKPKSDETLEGYGICLKNDDDENMVHVILDIVLVSEDIGIGEETLEAEWAKAHVSRKKGDSPHTDFDKTMHLTPLERSLDQSISAAHAVLREMKYMEKREARMRYTADSINTRVRWFSYLSIGVLLVVTYVQVTYLKRYFHKKKLM